MVQAALFPASDHEWLIDFRPNDSRSLTTNQMADLLGSDRYQGLLILLPTNRPKMMRNISKNFSVAAKLVNKLFDEPEISPKKLNNEIKILLE